MKLSKPHVSLLLVTVRFRHQGVGFQCVEARASKIGLVSEFQFVTSESHQRATTVLIARAGGS